MNQYIKTRSDPSEVKVFASTLDADKEAKLPSSCRLVYLPSLDGDDGVKLVCRLLAIEPAVQVVACWNQTLEETQEKQLKSAGVRILQLE